MISEVEQNLLYGVGAVVLLGTLIAFAWQWTRHRGDDDHSDDTGQDHQ